MDKLYSRIKGLGKFIIYGAGEFASLLVKYCAYKDIYGAIECCVVSEREYITPPHILGVKVVDFSCMSYDKDTPILVAILSERACKDINNKLSELGYKKIVFLSNDDFLVVNRYSKDFLYDIKREIRSQMAIINERMDKLEMLVNSASMVAEVHSRTFDGLKNIYKGKNIVLCGAGKTLEKYSFDDDFIHVGCNSVAFIEDVKLDYYFIQHIPNDKILHKYESYNWVEPDMRKKYLDALNRLKCVKFVGQAIGKDWHLAPPIGEFYEGEVKPYFYSYEVSGLRYFSKDIRYSVLYAHDSIIFPMIQFALFTNPNKIFLVGCDGYELANNYACDHYSNRLDELVKDERLIIDRRNFIRQANNTMKNRYEELKEFAHVCYPNTEIIMVNPKLYKGIFRETETDLKGRIVI